MIPGLSEEAYMNLWEKHTRKEPTRPRRRNLPEKSLLLLGGTYPEDTYPDLEEESVGRRLPGLMGVGYLALWE